MENEFEKWLAEKPRTFQERIEWLRNRMREPQP